MAPSNGSSPAYRRRVASSKSSLDEADCTDGEDESPSSLSLLKAASWLPALRPMSRHTGLTGNLNLTIGTTSMSPTRRSQLAIVQGASIASAFRATFADAQSRRLVDSSTTASLHSARAESVVESRGPVAPTTLAKSLSDSALLHGVSQPVMLQNALASRHMAKTVDRHEALHKLARGMQDSRPAGTTDEQGFATLTDGLAKTISELRDGHEAFDPRRGGRRTSMDGFGRARPRPGGPSAQAPADDEQSAERHERLAERLEAYKMARRIEPELPPLTTESNFRQERPEQSIVARNTLPEELGKFFPPMRRDMLLRRREEREQHQLAVASQRNNQIVEISEQFAEVLARKRMQAEAALSSRRNPNRKQSKRFAVDRWLTICCVVSWLRAAHEEMELNKMDMQARINYVENHVMKSRRSSSVVMQQVAFFGEIMMNEQLIRAMRLFVSVVKAKQRIMEQRKNSKMVYSSLLHWKIAGPFFIGIKQLAWQIRKLQSWWRLCVRRLHALRDGISKRWEKIERKEVYSELCKDRSVKVRGMKKITENEIMQEMITESTRTHFIEQELRARRYFMLPKIYLCEEDTRKFKVQTQSMVETRNVHFAMGIKPPETSPTYVGMDRPSYLPCAHLQSEARGGCCPEWCLGRKGDEDILSMIRTARQNRNGEGWTKIPQRRQSMARARPSGRTSAQRATAAPRISEVFRRERFSVEQATPFGEVAGDEELRKWGAGPEELPLMRNRG